MRGQSGKKLREWKRQSMVFDTQAPSRGLSSHFTSAPELSMIGPLFTTTKSFTVMAARSGRLAALAPPPQRLSLSAITLPEMPLSSDHDAVCLQTLHDRQLDRRHAGRGRLHAQIEPLAHVRHRPQLLPAAWEPGETNAHNNPRCHASGSSPSAERVGCCRMRPPYSAGAAEDR